MSKSKFKSGDLVQLKSGGPTMTVKGPSFDGDEIVCQWFGGKKLESGQFDADCLIPAPEEKQTEK